MEEKLTKLINGFYVSERTHLALHSLRKKKGSIKMYQLARMILDEAAEKYFEEENRRPKLGA